MRTPTVCSCVMYDGVDPECPAHGDVKTEHDWYHDGGRSNSDRPEGGRICRNCRFRENTLVSNKMSTCIGNSSLYDMAFADGHNAGTGDEKRRMRNLLTL